MEKGRPVKGTYKFLTGLNAFVQTELSSFIDTSV